MMHLIKTNSDGSKQDICTQIWWSTKRTKWGPSMRATQCYKV